MIYIYRRTSVVSVVSEWWLVGWFGLLWCCSQNAMFIIIEYNHLWREQCGSEALFIPKLFIFCSQSHHNRLSSAVQTIVNSIAPRSSLYFDWLHWWQLLSRSLFYHCMACMGIVSCFKAKFNECISGMIYLWFICDLFNSHLFNIYERYNNIPKLRLLIIWNGLITNYCCL